MKTLKQLLKEAEEENEENPLGLSAKALAQNKAPSKSEFEKNMPAQGNPEKDNSFATSIPANMVPQLGKPKIDAVFKTLKQHFDDSDFYKGMSKQDIDKLKQSISQYVDNMYNVYLKWKEENEPSPPDRKPTGEKGPGGTPIYR